MKRAECGEQKASRQCWECLKRRLVCDHTLPHCLKCIKAGKDCPGYDEQKPLQWVSPGKVTSRTRKKNPPKIYTIPQREPTVIVQSGLSTVLTSCANFSAFDCPEAATHKEIAVLECPTFQEPIPSIEAIEIYKNFLAAVLIYEDKADWWHGLTSEEQTEYVMRMAMETSAGVGVAERFMTLGSQRKLREMVQRGQEKEAAVLLQSNRKPLEKLKRLLWIMEMNQLPSYDHLSNETSEVVQAVGYCMFSPLAWWLLLIIQRQHEDIPRRQGN